MKLLVLKRYGGYVMGFIACFIYSQQVRAQIVCPPNIDFEKGDFSNWTAYIGSVAAGPGTNTITLAPSGGPIIGRHEIFSRATQSQMTDFFGGFPVVCPNGSGYSVKLGNNTGGREAEGLSYEFTIPSNRNTYSLTYHYAVVFQDPHHADFQQPRMEIEVRNLTDDRVIDCSSFTFIPFGAPLPGFFLSPTQQDTTNVWCKNWTAVTINLNGQAGKTIRLFFKTADCTFQRHFGYAYIDVDSECSGEFTGATYCPTDTAVNVIAPFGFQSYTWFNNNFSQVLGNQQQLTLQPPPSAGSLLAVEVTPFNGYGCKDTLYARLIDTLTVKANAGPDKNLCISESVLIGENSKPGIRYEWSPATGLSDPTISNPFASPSVKTTYVLTAISSGGGCRNSDSVTITPSAPDTTMQFLGKTNFCSASSDSAVMFLANVSKVQWYRDGVPVSVVQQRRFRVTQSGTYYAKLTDAAGCSLNTRSVKIDIEQPVPGITYPLLYTFVDTPLLLEARKIGNNVLWRPPAYLDESGLPTPTFLSDREVEQRYMITLTTAGGCTTIDTQSVKAIKGIQIFVPNAFTPNNDRLNDYFFPITTGLKEIYLFKVVNRWGKEIYSMPANSSGWDGTFNGMPQTPGVYAWYLSGVGIDKKLYVRKGTVTLIR